MHDGDGHGNHRPGGGCGTTEGPSQDPAERAERLRTLKESIRAGTYAPDIKDVAYLLATMMTPRN